MLQSKLTVHAYTGRENGLMIIGTREQLSQFAQDLLSGLDQPNHSEIPGWPAQILAIDAPSPYTQKDFSVSFHLQTGPLLPSFSSRPAGATSTPVFIAVAVLTLLGIFSIPHWGFHALQLG
jgi:hypothetical protein